MSATQILEILKSNKSFFHKEFGVESIGLFGSFARGVEGPESDIDILVRFKSPDYLAWCGLSDFLEQNLNRKIDLVTDGKHLSERFRKRVAENIIYA